MNILRTILRVGLIILLVVVLVFISVKIFKLIPQAINNLATATVSIGGLTDEKNNIATSAPATISQPAAPTVDGLNGVIIQPENITTTPTPNKVTPSTNASTKPKPVKTTRYVYTTDYVYDNSSYSNTGYTTSYIPTGTNIKLTLSSVGIIDDVTGQFVKTNSFRTTDTISVRFKILNEEARPTGTWNMRVTMPALDINDRVKNMTNLSSIPGESSYTAEARFTGIDMSQGTPVVRIYADPENAIAERNESDNTLYVELRNVQTYNSYNSNNQCYTNPYGQYTCYTNGYNNYNNQCYSQAYGWYNCGSNNYNDSYNNGNPNLMISSVEAGRMVGGTFYQSTTIPYGERVAVRVHVRNTGGYFNTSYTTRLGIQNIGTGYRELTTSNGSLQAGGEQIAYFETSDLIRGNHTFTIYVDSLNNVSETNESDNSQTVGIYVN